MAPTTQLLRISELEASSQKHEVELAVLRESHERLTEDVSTLRSDMSTTAKEVSSIKITLAAWSVGVSIIVGIGACVGGWMIKTSLDAVRASINTQQR